MPASSSFCHRHARARALTSVPSGCGFEGRATWRSAAEPGHRQPKARLPIPAPWSVRRATLCGRRWWTSPEASRAPCQAATGQQECERCGAPYEPRRLGGHPQRYCSPRCRRGGDLERRVMVDRPGAPVAPPPPPACTQDGAPGAVEVPPAHDVVDDSAEASRAPPPAQEEPASTKTPQPLATCRGFCFLEGRRSPCRSSSKARPTL